MREIRKCADALETAESMAGCALQPALAAEINATHAEAERSLRQAVHHAVRTGELLIQAKRLVGHGNWSIWLTDNVTFSDRLAQSYMRLARLPLEKRNAVADLPLREALSAIRSREKQLADADERMNRPPLGPARLATVVNGEVLLGHDAVRAICAAPAPPAPPLPTAEEVADSIIERLAQAFYEVRDKINIDDLRAAFDRRFGTSEIAEERSRAALADADGLDIPDFLRRTVS
jgi:hypothetical protein